jgi:hypothetical protein
MVMVVEVRVLVVWVLVWKGKRIVPASFPNSWKLPPAANPARPRTTLALQLSPV